MVFNVCLGRLINAGLTRRITQQSAMLSSGKFKALVYSCRPYDKEYLTAHLNKMKNLDISLDFEKEMLSLSTVEKASGYRGVSIFVNDECGTEVVERLANHGVEVIALRCTGFNKVDLKKAKEKGIKVCRVPKYSPYSVAEFTVGTLLALQRKITVAHNRVRSNNFSLVGLVGFDMHGKTVGIIGAGKIGLCAIDIFKGMGCKVLAYDVLPNKEAANTKGFEYVSTPDEIYKQCDVITIHSPLTPDNRYMINEKAISMMKPNVYIVNVGRGLLIDTKALLKGLKSGHIGGACLDVYENESDYFYDDLSGTVLQDDVLNLLIACPNVLVTSHQAYLTKEALQNISAATIGSFEQIAHGEPLVYEVKS